MGQPTGLLGKGRMWILGKEQRDCDIGIEVHGQSEVGLYAPLVTGPRGRLSVLSMEIASLVHNKPSGML